MRAADQLRQAHRPGPPPPLRLGTVARLTTNGNTEQPVFHLDLARRNGCTVEELKEALTHLAFYAGWPQAMAATAVAKKALAVTTHEHTTTGA